MDLQAGMQVRVSVPETFPTSEFRGFHEAWVSFAKSLDKIVVVLKKPDILAGVAGWHFSKEGLVVPQTILGAVVSWLPTEWLSPASNKTPCDCPLALVMRTGCKNQQHE